MANILIVDDEKNIRKTFELFLTKGNHTVFLAEDAESAMDILHDHDLDLILTDIIMPKITGMEMFETVKKTNPDLPVVIITGQPSLSTAKAAVKGGAVDYLVKPIKKDDLLQTVEYALYKKELADNKKLQEEKNRQRTLELERLLQSTNKIVELSPTPTFIIDIENEEIININKATLDFMRVDNAEDLSHINFFETIDKFDEIEKKFRENKKIDNIETKIKRKGTGELVWCLLNIHPILLADQHMLIVSFTNLDEILQAKKHLETAKQKAEEAAKTKSEFLSNMSHEIRTPLNAIIGFSELLGITTLNEKQEDYVDKLNISAKSLLDIINDILDFSKLESGKLNIDSIEFNLDELFTKLSTIISFSASQKNLNFSTRIDNDIPKRLIGDPLRLNQVLLNLCNNAIKFTEKGNVYLEAKKIADTMDDVTICFSVTDTGIGISNANQQKLFKAFTQADASATRKYGGTGLGLALSQSIIHQMGSELNVESKLGEGSKFYFELKLKICTDCSDSAL